MRGIIAADLDFGLRSLTRRPGFTFSTVLILIACVGTSLVVFSLVNAVWLRQPPFKDANRVVMVLGRSDDSGTSESLYFGRAFLTRLEIPQLFELVAGQVATSGDLARNLPRTTLPGGTGPIETLAVTWQYFSVLGLKISGRDFTADDDRPGGPRVAIISDRLWSSVFKRDPGIIGETLNTTPVQLQVIGVAPRGFQGARLGERADIWVSPYVVQDLGGPGMGEREPSLLAFAKLTPGVTPDEATRRVAVVASLPVPINVIPVTYLYGSPTSKTLVLGQQSVVSVAAGAAALVLFAGCATLASVALVHYERRRRELALRVVLGCSGLRLARAVVAELLSIVTVGVVGALAFDWAVITILPAVDLPGGLDIGRLDLSPDWRVALFAVIATMAMLAVAIVPALRRALRSRPFLELSTSTPTSTPSMRLRKAIVGAHAAVAVAVLVTTVVFVRAVILGYTDAPGFVANRTLFIEVLTRPTAGGLSAEQRMARAALRAERIGRFLERIQAMPSVAGAAIGGAPIGLDAAASAVPLRSVLVGSREHQLRASFLDVGPEYPSALGIRQIAGRPLTRSDSRDPGVSGQSAVLITESLAQYLWPREAAVGGVFRLSSGASFHVVGVVSDFAIGSLRLHHRMGVLLPIDIVRSGHRPSVAFTVHTSTESALLVSAVRSAAIEVFSDSPRINVSTGADVLARDLGPERLAVWFFTAFGVVILALGTGGVLGLGTYVLASRRREVGIRLALGARPLDIAKLVAVTAVVPVLLGTCAGVLAAIAAPLVVPSFQPSAQAVDLATGVFSVLLVLGAVLIASSTVTWRLLILESTSALRGD